VPKNIKELGHISSCYQFSSCCPSFFLAHAQFPRAKTLAADKFTGKSEFLNAAVFKLPHNSRWMRSRLSLPEKNVFSRMLMEINALQSGPLDHWTARMSYPIILKAGLYP